MASLCSLGMPELIRQHAATAVECWCNTAFRATFAFIYHCTFPKPPQVSSHPCVIIILTLVHFFSFFFSTAQHSTVIHFSTRSQAPWRLGAVSHVIFISLGQLQFFQNSWCGDYHVLLKKKNMKNGTKEQENETSVLSFFQKKFI